MARFERWNLLSDLRPLGRFDVIFCRNVLIYFDAPTKSRVLAALAAQLAPVQAAAKRHGLATPIADRLAALIGAVEAGERPIGRPLADELCAVA